MKSETIKQNFHSMQQMLRLPDRQGTEKGLSHKNRMTSMADPEV